jgi:hypothetical protein
MSKTTNGCCNHLPGQAPAAMVMKGGSMDGLSIIPAE